MSKVGGSTNNPVEISILHSFKRMRHFQPFEAIVEALTTSEILDLTEDNTAVKRKIPLPEEADNANAVKVFEDKAMPRSVYAKGFGKEQPSTQFDIEAFFAEHGSTKAIRLRRTEEKIFKGSVFVEFDDEDLQKKFLALEPKPKFQGTELLIKSKREYCEEKAADIAAGKVKPNEWRSRRKDDDERDWRERREDDRKKGFHNDRHGKRGGGRGYGSRGGRDRDGGRGDRSKRDSRDSRHVLASSLSICSLHSLILSQRCPYDPSNHL